MLATTLGQACNLKAGKFVSANDIVDEYADGLYPCFGGNGVRGYVKEFSHEGAFPLIGRQGALCGNVNLASGKFRATEHAVVVQPNVEMNIRWLYYQLLAMNLGQYATGAAQPGLAVATLEKLLLTIPPMDAQEKIAAALDKVSDLIALRKQQLAKLDELIKARFVEMFGDPTLNNKGFPTLCGKDYFKLSNGKAVPEEKRRDFGIPAYGGNGISWYTDAILCTGDTLVVGRVGFQSGNVHFAKGPLWITDNAMYISDFYVKDYNLIFLCALMEHIDFTKYQDAGDLKKITQKPFMKMAFIDPPQELQKQYSAVVAQTDKTKLKIQTALFKLETLKKALMQHYFK